MRRWCASLAVLLLLAAPDRSSAAPDGEIDGIVEAIDSWHLVEARQRLDRLEPAQRDEPAALYASGKLLFCEGRYADAQADLRRAIEGARAEIDWRHLRDRVAAAQRALSGLSSVAGRDDRFLYRFAPGADAVLVPYADATLRRQATALQEYLGDTVGYRIEVIFLPDVESLAGATGLSVEQIERTGTVGVTKYGRVMILSPRLLAHGYPWLDTLAHELTHISITRLSRARAPIWLQEGIAKLLERRWRGAEKGELTPEEAYVLDRAAREKRLIPLNRFHPSVAHLPNQEDAALAYAQVLSFLSYLDGRFEGNWLRTLLGSLAEGRTVDQGIGALSKFTLGRLYRWWKQSVSGRRQTPVPAVGLMKRRFKRGEATGGSFSDSLLDVNVRRHLRVGDLLRLRGHLQAAVAEFREAQSLAESPSPEISDRLAGSLLELGADQEVAQMLPELTALYPTHATAFVQLGRAQVGLEHRDEAIAAFERSLALNPFHAEVHCALAQLYRQAGRQASAGQAAEHCQLLAAGPSGESGAAPVK